MKDNREQQRFETEIDGQIVFADYERQDAKLLITHVETPVVLRGKGAAAKLMQEIADFAQNENLQIVPICVYAAAWVKRHSN